MHRCALYVPPQLDLLQWMATLTVGAERAGWLADRVVRDWSQMWDMLTSREVDIALSTSLDDLPRDREPRLEFLDRLTPPPGPGQRRPRRL